MESNNLFHDRYFLERLLGRGNFSEVWVAKDAKTGVLVALKIYTLPKEIGMDTQIMNVFFREFNFLSVLCHPNLLIPRAWNSSGKNIYTVTPYYKRGDVLMKVGAMDEKKIWRFMNDISKGLAFLHSRKIILQSLNIGRNVISPLKILIGDNYYMINMNHFYSFEQLIRTTIGDWSAGTPIYLAPECFSWKEKPTKASDIWSLGALIFEMVAGYTPFEFCGGCVGGLAQKNGAKIPELPNTWSKQLRKTITMCLSEKPSNRPSATDLVNRSLKNIN